MNNHTDILPQRDEARRQAVKVALAAFHAQGIRPVTMDEIAHSLTMSKRTLYQLFADKEELLIACMEEVDRRHRLRLQERMAETDSVIDLLLSDFELKMQELATISPDFFRDLAKYPQAMRRMQERRDENARVAVEFLKKGVAQGYLRPDLNLEILYDFIASTIELARIGRILNRFSLVEVFQHTIFVYIRGCATLKGAAIMDAFMERYRKSHTAHKS